MSEPMPYYIIAMKHPRRSIVYLRDLYRLDIRRRLAHHFLTLRMAKHRARTNAKMRQLTKQNYSWQIYKVVEDQLVYSSFTDTPLHRLAEAAE